MPNAANAGDFSVAQLPGQRALVPQGLQAPRGGDGTKWMLRFESVNYRATVWLNGKPIGLHTRRATCRSSCAAKGMRRGVNRLVVRVDSRRRAVRHPAAVGVRSGGTFEGGWWNYTGILREVYLRRVDDLDFENVVASAPPATAGRAPRGRTCATVVAQHAGRPGAAPRRRRRLGGQRIRLQRPPRSRRAASACSGRACRSGTRGCGARTHPHLYTGELEVSLRRRTSCRATRVNTGIRSIVRRRGRADAQLNGRDVNLRGASLHEDDADARRRAAARRHPRQLRTCCATWART